MSLEIHLKDPTCFDRPVAVQKTYLTLEALRFSLQRCALLYSIHSLIRIAAFAQPIPHKGSWKMVRLDWKTEPERVATFAPVANPCTCSRGPT
jgi:hypothetical protein